MQIHKCRRVSSPASRAPQTGQTNPSGHLDAYRYPRQASSVPKRCWNSKIVNGYSGRGTPPSYETGRMERTRYLDEFVFRHNRRRTPMAAFQTLLGLGAQQAPATYGQVIRAAA